MKSTVDDIRRRFDADVERFSNLDTGQSATVDAPLAMALVAQAAAAATPHARHILDVGCGAGNYTLKWRQYGEYLTRLKDDAYRDHVFAYVEKEDTPRPLLFQLDLLREVGFAQVDVLHKNVCFAAFGAVKG